MPHTTIEPSDKANRGAMRRKPGSPKAKTPVTKREQMIRMLRAPKGAGVDAISKKLCWQAHTIRAALSRLRKAGYEIRREQLSKGKAARYRIISTPNSEGPPNVA